LVEVVEERVQVTIQLCLMVVVEAAVAVEDKIKMVDQVHLVKVLVAVLELLMHLVMEVVVVAVQAL
jgi:hypothetical protein